MNLTETNINMEAGSTHIEVLQKYVKDNKLDIGLLMTVTLTDAYVLMIRAT